MKDVPREIDVYANGARESPLKKSGKLRSIRSVRLGTTGRGSTHPEHRYYGSRLPVLL